ncbi:hypothetical protein H5407_16200 [Mitsuaria sp. WAJ17]|uniref:hypothetical protein n=1 Tax=Mitsuaria sp. WAJ17 TaxID=2761452 RepID=UPI0016045D57|nr:hypothetical protein [Mitsuaria sp. WAJ17]MBB2486769.1 hypothetical protein [Mitsuaria sp. WAJ17]
MTARWKFALATLALSLLLCALPVWLLFERWYPAAWRPFDGGWQMMVLAGVAVLIAPVLAALVFKANRRALVLDMVVISVLQLVTLGFAVHALHQGRPAWIAFVKDDFRVLRPVRMRTLPATHWHSGPRWVGAPYALDPAVRAQQITRELADNTPVESLAESHVPIEQVLPAIHAAARPLPRLHEFNSADQVAAMLAAHPQAAGWLPLKGVERDGVVLVDAQGRPLQAVSLAPWP